MVDKSAVSGMPSCGQVALSTLNVGNACLISEAVSIRNTEECIQNALMMTGKCTAKAMSRHMWGGNSATGRCYALQHTVVIHQTVGILAFPVACFFIPEMLWKPPIPAS